MNSGSQTKSQVENTECRSKPSQLLLIRRKKMDTRPPTCPLHANNAVCFAVGHITAFQPV